jgi:hypothetical protein
MLERQLVEPRRMLDVSEMPSCSERIGTSDGQRRGEVVGVSGLA